MIPDQSSKPYDTHPETRLLHLLDTVLDGSYSESDRAEFSALLEEHPELTPLVVKQLRTHALLNWKLAPSTLAPQGFDVMPAREEADGDADFVCDLNDKDATATDRPTPQSSWRTYVGWIGAVAATLLVAALISAPGRTGVGRVVDAQTAVFAKSSTAIVGDRVAAGRLEIESGRFAMEFENDVKFEITGPASCEIVSGMLVKLQSGQATADVPRWARGFTIETPDVEVIDLGTRFGVATSDAGKTDVVVFEGLVDLKSLSTNKRPFKRRLTQGEAARIDRKGEIERIFQVHGESVGNNWSTADLPNQGAIITAVWDNFNSTKSVSYYQIVTGGFGEDAPAYVDHPHQWNAFTKEGLPEFLRGADYVRTINDFRYHIEQVIHVEIARDSTLYVLFDNRTPAPGWLKEQFVNTTQQVGLDEDAWLGNPTFSVDVGPGVSIDNVFTVWSRPCSAGDVMTLGSMGAGGEARAMYGIVAVPR
jgi:hypothetical protein